MRTRLQKSWTVRRHWLQAKTKCWVGCNATVVQVLHDLFYVLLHVLFYLWSLPYKWCAHQWRIYRYLKGGAGVHFCCTFSKVFKFLATHQKLVQCFHLQGRGRGGFRRKPPPTLNTPLARTLFRVHSTCWRKYWLYLVLLNFVLDTYFSRPRAEKSRNETQWGRIIRVFGKNLILCCF